MSDVKPALSREEWVRAWVSSAPATETAARILEDRGDVGAPGTPKRINTYQKVVAALCLHGQPYGFTWDMVDALRKAASLCWERNEVFGGTEEENDEAVAPIIAAADLIEALLPPREEP